MVWQYSPRFRPAARAALVVGILLAVPVLATAQSGAFLSVTKVGGDGLVTTAPVAEGVCRPFFDVRCAWAFPVGTVVTLMVEPQPGMSFTSWGGDADCADGTVTLSSDRRCLAFFDSGPPTPSGSDFSHDGHPDLLWTYPTGWLTAWLLNGTALLEARALVHGRDRVAARCHWRHRWRWAG